MHFLQVEGLCKNIGHGFTLQELRIGIKKFSKVAIVGETGSGKTTLLKMMAGLLQPDAGTILLEGEKLLGPAEKLLPGHKSIAYLSQYFELRNNYRVADFLEMAVQIGPQKAAKIYSLCRVDHLLNRKTSELSGGERQRIALARLLVAAPKLLLLDEPFSNLDAIHKGILKNVLAEISAELALTCILVSHDPPDIMAWADDVYIMKDGAIIQNGSPLHVYQHPVNEYAAALFGKYNLLSAQDANMFGKNDVGAATGQPHLIRPGEIMLEPATNEQVAVVKDVFYIGNYSEVHLQVKDFTLIVYSFLPGIKTGQQYALQLRQPLNSYRMTLH